MNTDTIQDFTQDDVDQYLRSVGLNPGDAMWKDMRAIVHPLIPNFLAWGGTYGAGNNESRSPDCRTMTVSYRYPWLHLSVKDGLIELKQPGSPAIVVHPSHLDTALCRLLGVRNPRDILISLTPKCQAAGVEYGRDREAPPAVDGSQDIVGLRVRYGHYYVIVASPFIAPRSGLRLLRVEGRNSYETVWVESEGLDNTLCQLLGVR